MTAQNSIKNAIIDSTAITRQRGIPTCQLHIRYEGSGQSFGGYDLRFEKYGIPFLMRILETVGVSKWEDLPGQMIRIDGNSGKIVAIGHIMDEKWFNPEDELHE